MDWVPTLGMKLPIADTTKGFDGKAQGRCTVFPRLNNEQLVEARSGDEMERRRIATCKFP